MWTFSTPRVHFTSHNESQWIKPFKPWIQRRVFPEFIMRILLYQPNATWVTMKGKKTNGQKGLSLKVVHQSASFICLPKKSINAYTEVYSSTHDPVLLKSLHCLLHTHPHTHSSSICHFVSVQGFYLISCYLFCEAAEHLAQWGSSTQQTHFDGHMWWFLDRQDGFTWVHFGSRITPILSTSFTCALKHKRDLMT